jgi:hypothetical protein
MGRVTNIKAKAIVKTVAGTYLIPDWIEVLPGSTLDNIKYVKQNHKDRLDEKD